MNSAAGFLEKLKSTKFQIPHNTEWAVSLRDAEDIVSEMGKIVDNLRDETACSKVKEARFYQEEKRVLDAHEVCKKCKHLESNGKCKLKTICKQIAIDYYEEA
jgi:hypothetical protein